MSRKGSGKGQKKKSLGLAVGLGFVILGILVVGITTAVAPWSAFHNNSFVGTKNNRFYSFGSYDKIGEEYQEAVYKQLKGTESGDADKDASGQANAASGKTTSSSASQSTNSSAKNSAQNSTTGGAMANIVIAEADNSPYNRSDYGSGWDVPGLACNIRATILKQTSLVAVQTAENGCTVTYGSWVDPYSGATLTGNPYQGDGTANDLDIDHIIPLKYVNAHGGYGWSASDKVAYGKSVTAMNNGVYLAVSASENRKKGDSGPADYYPSNPDFYCEYAKRWRDTARTYAISLSGRDYNKIQGVLVECNIN